VQVSLSFHREKEIDRFRGEVLEFPEVLECYHVAGEGDYLLKVASKDIQAYRDWLVTKLTTLEVVQRVQTLIVFETMKRETKLSVDEG
jgi:Lrp/AsnC family leucine-responsive transcriptional regulator